MVWNNRIKIIRLGVNDQKGQSVVEYLLLMGVVVALSFTFFHSALFKSYFSGEGDVFTTFRKTLEYSYRNGLPGMDQVPAGTYPQSYVHPSYVNQPAGMTRFFGPVNKYP